MNNITIFEGQALENFLASLGVESYNPALYRVRFHQTEEGIKVKVNEGVWSPSLGKRDQ